MCELKNTKQVELSDRIRFRCMRCAECCRHVENTVIIEVKDAFYIAKHLGITVSEFYEKYTEMLMLEDTGFPVFALKTTGKDKSCIFLKGKRCTIQSIKPITCKMYPFWVHPDDNGGFVYNYSTERRHHPKGSLIRVKDWMNVNMSEEDRDFLSEELSLLKDIAIPYKILYQNLKDPNSILGKLLFFRHFMYETDEPFMEQFRRNHRILKEELERILDKFKSV